MSDQEDPKLPLIPLDLLEALERRYPERSYEPGDTLEDLMFAGGKRDLVRWLRTRYDRQSLHQDDEDE